MINESEPIELLVRVQRFLVRAYSRAALPYLAVALLLAVALVIAGHEVEHHLHSIESWITDLGPWGPLAFILFFVVTTSFLMPDTVLRIIAGTLFGMAWGVATVLAGALVAATVQFVLARKLLRARIERKLASKPSLLAIQRAVSGDEFRLQLLLRLTPLNPAIINYLLGSAGVRFSGFIAASLALAPNLLVEIYFGHVGKSAAHLAGGTSGSVGLHHLALFGGLAVCVVVMIVISKTARKALMAAVAETERGKQRITEPN